MYPIKLNAPLKDYIWGGTSLKQNYGKVSELEKVAESWELACHDDGNSIVINGKFKDKTLSEVIAEYIANDNISEFLGENINNFPNKETLPVLIKLIDADDNLSVQVHPNNEYGLRVEGEYGKTEVWYVIEAKPDATLIYGLNKDTTKEEFKEHISNGTLLDICNIVNVKKGDVFFIPAGTLHGIGKGIVIAEVQQNSNTTYRVFDYNRVGADGKQRELHIEKAIDVTILQKQQENIDNLEFIEENDFTKRLISTCEYFTTYSIQLKTNTSEYQTLVNNKSFCSVLCLECNQEGIVLESKQGNITIQKGESVFLQANYGEVLFKGKGELLLTTV